MYYTAAITHEGKHVLAEFLDAPGCQTLAGSEGGRRGMAGGAPGRRGGAAEAEVARARSERGEALARGDRARARGGDRASAGPLGMRRRTLSHPGFFTSALSGSYRPPRPP